MMSTKDKIIDVLVSNIKAGKNLQELSLSQIANEALIGKSTVYEYFKSKEEMISSTYVYLLEQYECILLKPLVAQTFEKAFMEQLSNILVVMRDAKQIMDAIMNLNYQNLPLITQEHKELMIKIQNNMSDRFEAIISIGVKEGLIDLKQIKPTSKVVVQALIQGILLQFINQETDLTEASVCELILVQTLKAIN